MIKDDNNKVLSEEHVSNNWIWIKVNNLTYSSYIIINYTHTDQAGRLSIDLNHGIDKIIFKYSPDKIYGLNSIVSIGTPNLTQKITLTPNLFSG